MKLKTTTLDGAEFASPAFNGGKRPSNRHGKSAFVRLDQDQRNMF